MIYSTCPSIPSFIPNTITHIIGNLLKGNVSASSLQEDAYFLRCVLSRNINQRGNVIGKVIHVSLSSHSLHWLSNVDDKWTQMHIIQKICMHVIKLIKNITNIAVFSQLIDFSTDIDLMSYIRYSCEFHSLA